LQAKTAGTLRQNRLRVSSRAPYGNSAQEQGLVPREASLVQALEQMIGVRLSLKISLFRLAVRSVV
jgi:hypothetical protein